MIDSTCFNSEVTQITYHRCLRIKELDSQKSK